MTLDDLLAATSALPADAPLVFTTEQGPIGAGYHVTELKLAVIRSIDCGGRKDAWTEATLQLLDGAGRSHMQTGKFVGILEQSLRSVEGLGQSPLRVEFSHGNRGLSLFELAPPVQEDGQVMMRLTTINAACKPALERVGGASASSCCAPAVSSCCGVPA